MILLKLFDTSHVFRFTKKPLGVSSPGAPVFCSLACLSCSWKMLTNWMVHCAPPLHYSSFIIPWITVKWKLVSHFKLWRPAIFEPVDLGKTYIPLLKALSSGYWNLKWNWKYLCLERRQTNFSDSGAFSCKWAWQPPGWCHTQFYFWF